MYIFHETATLRRAAGSPLCGFTTSVMRRTRWTPWMARCWMGGSCACRWHAMDGRPSHTTGAEEARHEALDDAGAVAPEAGVVLGPVAARGTADQGPVPTPAPGLAPKLVPHAESSPNPSQSLCPSPSHAPDLSPSLSPAPGPEAAHQPLPETPSPGRGPRAYPSLQRRREQCLHNLMTSRMNNQTQ